MKNTRPVKGPYLSCSAHRSKFFMSDALCIT